MADIRRLLATAQYAALKAGKAIMQVYQSEAFSTEMKPDETPVTLADKRSHAIITEHLDKTNLPVLSEEGIRIDFDERKDWEYFWLIDPLDGTKEFINKNGEFTVNIALIKKDTPVAGVLFAPCTDALYTGSNETGAYKIEKGRQTLFAPLAKRNSYEDLLKIQHLRVVGSRSHMSDETRQFIRQFPNAELTTMGSSLKFMLLLENRADIYPRLGTTMEWDTAAGHAILNASNRGVYQVDLKTELVYNKADTTNPFFVAF